MSCSIASCALRLMSGGAEKSGKPCDRFTAPCFSASRVISRITDSVNKLAFRDTYLFFDGAAVIYLCLLVANSRDNLLTRSFALELVEYGAYRGRIAAIGR